MKTQLQAIYLHWLNNFITVGAFADHYHITDAEAEALIRLGRRFHEEIVESTQREPA